MSGVIGHLALEAHPGTAERRQITWLRDGRPSLVRRPLRADVGEIGVSPDR
jgi:hypothetical protein